jgi:hypothetical protein
VTAVPSAQSSTQSYSTPSALRPHLLRSAVFLLPVAVSLVVLLIGMGFSILTGLSVVGGSGARPIIGPEVSSGLTLFGLGGAVVTGLAWFASLFAAVRETVGEGSGRIEDGSGDAVEVRDLVRDHLGRRCPSWNLRVGEVDGHPSLSVDDGDGTSAVIIVRAVGPDLRIAWSASRTRSTGALILDQFPGSRGSDLSLLDADAASAMAGYVGGAVEHAVRSHAS